jgi:AcrR family transcriptional regulator
MSQVLTQLEKDTADVRRSELLNAAASIFSTKGYHAASMRELAKLLNIKAGSLYYHIASKEQLLNEVCSIGMQELLRNADQALKNHDNFVDRLRAIIVGHASVVQTYGDYLRCYQSEHAHLSPSTRETVRLQLVQFHRTVEDVVASAISSGEIRANVNIKSARLAVTAFLFHISRMQAEQHPADLQDIAAEFADIALLGFTQR